MRAGLFKWKNIEFKGEKIVDEELQLQSICNIPRGWDWLKYPISGINFRNQRNNFKTEKVLRKDGLLFWPVISDCSSVLAISGNFWPLSRLVIFLCPCFDYLVICRCHQMTMSLSDCIVLLLSINGMITRDFSKFFLREISIRKEKATKEGQKKLLNKLCLKESWRPISTDLNPMDCSNFGLLEPRSKNMPAETQICLEGHILQISNMHQGHALPLSRP